MFSRKEEKNYSKRGRRLYVADASVYFLCFSLLFCIQITFFEFNGKICILLFHPCDHVLWTCNVYKSLHIRDPGVSTGVHIYVMFFGQPGYVKVGRENLKPGSLEFLADLTRRTKHSDRRLSWEQKTIHVSITRVLQRAIIGHSRHFR
jgi:hypothetical protein